MAKLERSPPKSATPDDRSQWLAEPVILLEQSRDTADSCDRVQEIDHFSASFACNSVLFM